MFESLTALENVYAGCAILGGSGFGIWMILQLFGVASEVSADVDAGVDFDGVDSSSDLSFKLVSFQGITAFFLMFGLVGLALSRGDSGMLASMLGALAAGFAAVFVMAKIFQFARKLHSSGTITMEDTIGGKGIVYLTIPEGGQGKVQITTAQKRFMELNAVSEDGDAIETGVQIHVVKYISGSTVSVKRTLSDEGEE